MSTIDSVEVRVARGVAWLDANRPGWREYVTLSQLDMASACKCVLGQVFAIDALEHGVRDGFEFANYELLDWRDEDTDDVDAPSWAIRHGFDVLVRRAGDGPRGYAELQVEWKRVLAS